MKSFEELTTKELTELTKEQIDQFIDYELMCCGIVKPVKPQEPQKQNVTFTTIDMYSVKVNYTSILFKTIEDANTFIQMQPQYEDSLYNFPAPYNKRAVSNYNGEYELVPVKIVIDSDVQQYQSQMKKEKKEQEEYEKALKEYEKSMEAANEIIEKVWNAHYKAITIKNKYEQIIKTWQQYVIMCDNNAKIAMNFMEKAYMPDDIKAAMEWFDYHPPV